MAQRATSLGPRPSLLFCFFFVLFSFFSFCFIWGGGFKGQVRWPKGPPHLALNPPFFVFLFLLFVFLKDRKNCFPPKKGHFCCSFFCVSLCFFLAFLGPPPFSLSLSLSLSFLLFFSSFLSVFHFCIWFLFFLFFLFCLFFIQVDLQFLFLFFFFYDFCLLSCFVLNHNLKFVFVLHLVFLLLFLVFVAFIFCYFFMFGNLSKTSLKKKKHGNSKNSKNEKCRKTKKTDILTRTISTSVFTNSVFFFFFFFVFLSILHFC